MSMREVIDRAVADPEFALKLSQDFVGTTREAGIEVSPAEIKDHLRMPQASDEEAVQALQERMSMATMVEYIG